MIGPGHQHKDPAVSHLISYIVFSAILVTFTVLVMLTIPMIMTQTPYEQLTSSSFVDIGNGISTRIIDLHSVRPLNGYISSKISFPREIVGNPYLVEVLDSGGTVKLSQGKVATFIPLPGISLGGEGVSGNASSMSLKRITYYSIVGSTTGG